MNKKKLLLGALMISLAVVLGGCQFADSWLSDFKQQTYGLPMTVQTYDYNAQKIDTIHENPCQLHEIKSLTK